MDKELHVTLRPLGGSVVLVQSKASETVRSLLAAAGFESDQNTRLICVSRGNQLQLDLSLGVQGIQTNDIIFVLCHKEKIVKKTDNFNDNVCFSERMRCLKKDKQNELFKEALRVSDMSFLLFDYYQPSSIVYQNYLSIQDDLCDASDNGEEETILEDEGIDKKISESPLPVCWDSDSESFLDEEEESADLITE